MVVKAPIKSLIQFFLYGTPIVDEIPLPVVEDDDIAFQVIVTADDATQANDAATSDHFLYLLPADVTGIIDAPTMQAAALLAFDAAGNQPDPFLISSLNVLLRWNYGLPAFKTVIPKYECFRLGLLVGYDTSANYKVLFSNIFYREENKRYNSAIEYYCNENAYGFQYCNVPDLYNAVRLPFYITEPQFQDDEKVYFKSNGRRKITKSVTSKEYRLKTDHLPASIHEKLKIALSHDEVNVSSYHYSGGIVKNGGYDIDWTDVETLDVAMAKAKVYASPYQAYNNNCETCPSVPADPSCPVPELLSLTVNGDGDIVLTWNAFAYNAIHVERTEDGGSVFGHTSTGSGISPRIYGSLPPGTYQFRIIGNCNGFTTPSNILSITI